MQGLFEITIFSMDLRQCCACVDDTELVAHALSDFDRFRSGAGGLF